MSVSGCKSLTSGGVRKHKQRGKSREKSKYKTSAKRGRAHKHRPAETSTYGDKNRGRDSEGEAKYKHHACSIMAKSSQTHTHSGRSSQDHFHLSPLSFTQFTGKVHAIPQQKGCQRGGQGSKLQLTGPVDDPGGLVALSHDWAVFGFEQKHVMLR